MSKVKITAQNSKQSKTRIVKFQPKYAEEITCMIKETYRKFCANDTTVEGAKKYIDKCNWKKYSDEIIKNFIKQKIFFIALDKGEIVGIIAGNKNRVGMLFVQGKYHKNNIGITLIKKFEQKAKEQNSNCIKIRASLYSVPFYLKVGYKKTTSERMKAGNRFQPMMKVLK